MDMVIVTDWEPVEKDSFYLTNEKWVQNNGAEAQEACLAALGDNNLFVGYLVGAKTYLGYSQMDAQEVYINSDFEILMYCEGEVIGNKHKQVYTKV